MRNKELETSKTEEREREEKAHGSTSDLTRQLIQYVASKEKHFQSAACPGSYSLMPRFLQGWGGGAVVEAEIEIQSAEQE